MRTAILLLTLLLLTGCWDAREINTLAFILAVGIDLGEDSTYEVTYQVAVPQPQGEAPAQEQATWVTSAQGRTIAETLARTRHFSSRRPFFGHVRMVVIGEELAQQGVGPVLDFLERSTEFRRSLIVLVVSGTAKAALQANPTLEPVGAVAILRLVSQNSGVFQVPLGEFITALNNPTTDPPATYFRLRPPDETLVQDEAQGGGGSPPESNGGGGGEEEETVAETETYGIAVFRGDRMVGILDEAETRGFLMIQSVFADLMYTIDTPQGPIAVHLHRIQTQLQPRLGDPLTILMSANVNGSLVEASFPVDLTQPGVIQGLEAAFSRQVAREMEAAFSKLQTLQADLLGISGNFSRKFPQQWQILQENWQEDRFPKIRVQTQVNTLIRQPGMTLRSRVMGDPGPNPPEI